MNNTNLASKEYWDSGYDDFKFSPMPKNYPVCKMLYKYFKPSSEESVFEIGIFPGRFIYHFGKLGYELNGIDQTPFLKDMTNWFNNEKFKMGNLENGDLLKMSTDKKFDIVFSSGFIEHFMNFEDIIKIHCDLTKPGGYVFLTAPNFAGTIQKFLHTTFDKENIERHNLQAMDVKKWEQILIKNDFEIIESGYFGGFDFWTDTEKIPLLKKIISKILVKITPIRFLPNSKSYSPESILIAKKKNFFA